VAIVSEDLARHLWPAGDAVGKSIAYVTGERTNAPVNWLEVVGVAGNVNPVLPERSDYSMIYSPTMQIQLSQAYHLELVVRGPVGGSARLMQQVKQAVDSADPFAQTTNVQTLHQRVSDLLYPRRASTWLISTCGLAGLLLACFGIHGAISHSLAQRRQDLAIRMALGADRLAIVTLVLREGVSLTVLAAIQGLGLALLAMRITDRLLAPAPNADASVFASVFVVIVSVTVATCAVPAVRAARHSFSLTTNS
jgi:hypothetical protein